MSDSLRPHGQQNTKLLYHLPRACSNSCSLSQWHHPTISSFVIPFSSCLQSFPASESFPMSWLFESHGQSTGISALASLLPKNTQGWSPSEWTGWISLQSKGLSRVFSNTTVQKHQFFGTQLSSHTMMQISHNYICNFFKQTFHSSEINNREKNILACFILSYLVNVIWNIWYPAIKEANLERLCFPDPPTPTSNAFPHDVRIIREICFEIK